jgi:hypothetical protein
MSSLGKSAPLSACPEPAPTADRGCQQQACSSSAPRGFSLVYGPWSDCASACGASDWSRAVTCQSQDGYLAQLSSCIEDPSALAAQLRRPCPAAPPCLHYAWSYGDWVCSNPAGCGGGTSAREATCRHPATLAAVDPGKCLEAERDNSTQPCAVAACETYFWQPRELGDCVPVDPASPCGRVSSWRGKQSLSYARCSG